MCACTMIETITSREHCMTYDNVINIVSVLLLYIVLTINCIFYKKSISRE